MIAVLTALDRLMTALGLNYEYLEYSTSPPPYPYWVGEYNGGDPGTEDGQTAADILLTGWTRDSKLGLELEHQKIKDATENGWRVYIEADPAEGRDRAARAAIFYSSSLPVPSGEEGLSRVQITLQIKLWKG